MSTDLVPKKHGGQNKGQPKYKLTAAPSVVRNVERRLLRIVEKRGIIEKDDHGNPIRRDLTPEERACVTADPLEILVSLAGGLDPLHPGDEVDLETRVDAAKAAAQYTRPKITEITGAEGASLNAPAVFDMGDIMKLPVEMRRQLEDAQIAWAKAQRLLTSGTLKAEVVKQEFVEG